MECTKAITVPFPLIRIDIWDDVSLLNCKIIFIEFHWVRRSVAYRQFGAQVTASVCACVSREQVPNDKLVFLLSTCVGRAREFRKLKFFIFASRDERENMPWVLGKTTFYEKLKASKNIQSAARSVGLVRLACEFAERKRNKFSYFVSGVRVAREWFVYLSYCVACARVCVIFSGARIMAHSNSICLFREPVQFSLLRKFSLCRSAANYCIQIRGYFAVMQLKRVRFVRRTIPYDSIDSCNWI